MRCPKRPSCFDKAGIRRRVLASSCYPAFFRGHQRVGTPEYLTMMRLRKIWAEGSFSVLKREHCISRIRKRGILAATEECLLAAMALNLKRMVNAIFRYLQIYCSAGTTVGFSRIFAFVNRSLILPYRAKFCRLRPRPGSFSCFSFVSALRFDRGPTAAQTRPKTITPDTLLSPLQGHTPAHRGKRQGYCQHHFLCNVLVFASIHKQIRKADVYNRLKIM